MALHLHPDPTGGVVLTKVKLIAVDGVETIEEFELEEAPKYEKLKRIIEPHIGDWFERVAVWDNFGEGKMRGLDMFVDENGHLKRLPRNEKATRIYRAANQHGVTGQPPARDAETIPFIVGPAVLFNRRVWF